MMHIRRILSALSAVLLSVSFFVLPVAALSGWVDADTKYIDRPGQTFGEHGFSLDCPQARTLLWLKGPGIKRGFRLAEANLVDIAPTLAKALGLDLPQAEGKALDTVFER